MSNLHIVVCGHVIDTEAAGAGRRLRGILSALPPLLASGERITVLHGDGLPPPRTAPGDATQNAVRWHAVDWPATPAWRRAHSESAQLGPLLRQLGADVVDLGALPVPKGLPCASSIILHDLRDLDGFARRPLPTPLVRTVINRSLRRVDRIIVPSAFTAERIAAHRLARGVDVDVVPGGVTVAQEPAPLIAQSDDHKTILHVGHLEVRKRIDVLIDALALLPESYSLRLIGASPKPAHRRALQGRAARRGLKPPRLRFEGVVDDATLAHAIRECSVVALPSAYEGFGLVALEALAHGLPVVAHAGSAFVETLTSQGTLVDGFDASAWAQALREAAEQDSDAARRARVDSARSMSWSRCAQLTLESWRRTTASRGV